MAQSNILNTLVAAGVASVISTAVVYAGFTFWPPARDAAFETAVHEYLIANPQILIELDNALAVQQETERRVASETALETIGFDALLDPSIAYIEGPEDAPVTVVEFFDYRCGYCKASLPAIKAALEERDDVRFAFIEYPILSQDSLIAARAAVAARRQPGFYLPFHLALMEAQGNLPLERVLDIARDVGLDVGTLQTDMADEAVTRTIETANALARDLHVGGTPTFVINGELVVGQVTEERLNSAIDAAGS